MKTKNGKYKPEKYNRKYADRKRHIGRKHTSEFTSRKISIGKRESNKYKSENTNREALLYTVFPHEIVQNATLC